MWNDIKDLYTYAMEKGADPRVKDFFLMSSPVPTIFIVAIYLVVVTKIGPKLMEKRKPLDLKYVLMIYNAFQVVTSVILLYMNLYAYILGGFSLANCQDINFSTTEPEGVLSMYGVYYYFLLKFVELLDTLFFVLRKKQSQVTFLHLFHHVQLPLFSWMCVKFLPGGSVSLGMSANSLVHVIMYTYYFLAGLGPHMQKYLWWKKYLTSLQLIQFAYALMHVLNIMLNPDQCKTLYRPFVVVGAMYILALYILFKRFYNNSYTEELNSKDE